MHSQECSQNANCAGTPVTNTVERRARDWFFIQPLRHCPTTIRAMAAKPTLSFRKRIFRRLDPRAQGPGARQAAPGMYTRTDNPCTSSRKCWTTPPTRPGTATAKIKVTLHTDGSVSIEDDGRGIPFGMHPEEKAPVIELVFTRLARGWQVRQGQGRGLQLLGRLHGVGVSVTNALATRLEALQPPRRAGGTPGVLGRRCGRAAGGPPAGGR